MASRAVACSTARPPATTFVTRSRSVTMPTRRLEASDSTTGTEPTSSFFINSATRVTASFGSQQTGSRVISSRHVGIGVLPPRKFKLRSVRQKSRGTPAGRAFPPFRRDFEMQGDGHAPCRLITSWESDRVGFSDPGASERCCLFRIALGSAARASGSCRSRPRQRVTELDGSRVFVGRELVPAPVDQCRLSDVEARPSDDERLDLLDPAARPACRRRPPAPRPDGSSGALRSRAGRR